MEIFSTITIPSALLSGNKHQYHHSNVRSLVRVPRLSQAVSDVEMAFRLSDSVSTRAVGCQQRASVAGETGTGDFNPNEPPWAQLS